jgi:hypothetical protein
MKAGKEAFTAICTMLTQDPRFKRALAKVKVHETTGYRWLRRSQQGDPSYQFVWLDDAPVFFHVAVAQAQAMYYHSVIQQAEHYAFFGRTRETRFKGERVYRRDPELDLFTDEQLLERGITSRYLRDELTGEPIPETEHHDAPVQLQLAVLQARAPKIYSTKISHEVSSRVSLGVTVVQPPKVAPPVTVVQPPAIEPPRDVIEGEYTEAPPKLDFLDEPPKPPRGFKIG